MPITVSDLNVVCPTVLALEDVKVGDVKDYHLSVCCCDAPLATVAMDLLRESSVLQLVVW